MSTPPSEGATSKVFRPSLPHRRAIQNAFHILSTFCADSVCCEGSARLRLTRIRLRGCRFLCWFCDFGLARALTCNRQQHLTLTGSSLFRLLPLCCWYGGCLRR